MRATNDTKFDRPRKWVWALYIFAGAALMLFGVHPMIEGVHLWRSSHSSGGWWSDLFMRPLSAAFRPEMAGMSLWLLLAGATTGAGFAWLHVRLTRRYRRRLGQESWSEEQLKDLIAQGESDTLEFKSSVRWDIRQQKVNKGLEAVIAKAIAGLMNHRGGNLLIGVDDRGMPLGIDADMKTLRQPDWDDFERCITGIVESKLGGEHCTRIHCHRVALDGTMVALVAVRSASGPVYCRDGGAERYYVRMGNSTRELDVKEALAHIKERRFVS